MRNEKNERRYPRFRAQLFVLLTVFIAVMLCLLWVFQIGLLRPMPPPSPGIPESEGGEA